MSTYSVPGTGPSAGHTNKCETQLLAAGGVACRWLLVPNIYAHYISVNLVYKTKYEESNYLVGVLIKTGKGNYRHQKKKMQVILKILKFYFGFILKYTVHAWYVCDHNTLYTIRFLWVSLKESEKKWRMNKHYVFVF